MATRKPPKPDPLATYRAKRAVERTPEPGGTLPAAASPMAGGVFVVHMHAATRLHWDLRLEMHGVLTSWAVPRGPSKDQADKRYAVHVENHPLEYGDFEGMIPEGNYGAGAVIIWDRGRWIPLEDPDQGLVKGKLLFELQGHKLRGRWTLVKLKKDPKGWLLIKERDAFMVPGKGDDFPASSVLSGLTVEDLKAGRDPADAVRAILKRIKAKPGAVKAKEVTPMLAETREAAFTKAGWLFELKLDGYRIIAERTGGVARLWSRNGHDLTGTFPEVAKAVTALPYDGLLLDGEVVVHDERGLPSFSRLQQRGRLTKPLEVRRAAVELPAVFYVFDCIAALGHDLRERPVTDRKTVLRAIIPAAGALKYLDHVETEGEGLYEQIERMGLEGIVAKKADSPYRSRRSEEWLKIRADRVDDFVVVGMSRPKGSRGGFGALHLAQYTGRQLVYAGRVGSGFDAKALDGIAAALGELVVKKPPCVGPLPKGAEEIWVEPRLVAEVRYKEFTSDGLLRHPVFLRFREDKDAKECIRQVRKNEGGEGGKGGDGGKGGKGAAASKRRRGADAASPVSPVSPLSPLSSVSRPSFVFSNLEKIFWKDEGYTKGDLINFYREIAPWLLPYLDDRPLVLTRYPDGIAGKSFFQKDAPEYAQGFVRTVTMWSADSQRDLDYFVVGSVDELLYIANMAAIPLHIWGSRVASLETPDWCILDLDPKGAPFTDVVKVARVAHDLCDDIEWPAYVKTSGSSGLHILLPLGRVCTYEQCRTLAGLLARLIAAELPETATIIRQVQKREGKVYIDWIQNGHGRLLAAPFSVRPVPGALVSAPLDWKEVTPKLELKTFTIRSMPERMRKRKQDPMVQVLEDRPDLGAVLERLHRRVTKQKA